MLFFLLIKLFSSPSTTGSSEVSFFFLKFQNEKKFFFGIIFLSTEKRFRRTPK
jgi:hypothetical protein